MKHIAVLALAASALMACTTMPTEPRDPPVPPADKDTCGARQYEALVGKPATSPGVPPPSRMLRHIRPNSIVTMDFSETRVNFNIDKDDIIVSVSCG